MLETAKQKVPDLNALILNGDFLAHHMTTDKTADEALAIIKEIMSEDMAMMRSKFPNVPILPSIGNNDVIDHN